MNRVLYIDVFFFWNFVMDFVSLLLGGLIAGEKGKWGRLVLSSLFGAVSSCGAVFLDGGRPLEFILGFFIFIPMVPIAYGKLSFGRFLKLFVTAFCAALFLSGAALYLSYFAGKSRAGLTPAIFLFVLFLTLGGFFMWGNHLKRKLESLVISLSISHGEREACFYGLVDSGAFLKEPESGLPVILVKAEYAASLLSSEELFNLKTGAGEGVYPIPIRTASGGGCLYAFRPRSVRFHCGKRKKKTGVQVMVALDFSGGGFGGCPCLVPMCAV